MNPRSPLLPLLAALFLGGCAGFGGSGASAPAPAGSPFADVTANSAPGAPGTTAALTPAPAPSSPNIPPAQIDNDRLRVGDVVTIRLAGVPVDDAAVFDIKIGDQGDISMPLLPGTLRAAGLTTSQLKDEIESAYRSRKIYSTPNISIVPQLRYVNVSGEVRSPQRIPFTNDLTILKALAACGGFTDYASKHQVKLLRGGQAATFDAVAAIKNPALDAPLAAGDQIEVPRSIF